MIFISFASKLLRILNDKASPSEIAGAVALGAIVGLLPGFNLLSFFILIVIFLVNVNLSSAFLAIGLFKPLGYILDPLSHQIGFFLLAKLKFLEPFWTFLYSVPLMPFTRFNNTVILGSLTIGFILFIPLFLIIKKGVIQYRQSWLEKIKKWKIVQAFKASKLFNLYMKIRNFKEA